MFYDRHEAGEMLADKLKKYRRRGVVVCGLPRGGVIVAKEVARLLQAPLSIIVTRKITHPASPEYAIGAIGEHTELIFNEAEYSQIDPRWLRAETEKERRELLRRKQKYLAGRKPLSAHGKVAIIVDDGIATGLTMQAAIEEVRKQDPIKLVVAVPVAPAETTKMLGELADEVVVVEKPRLFRGAVGAYYDQFEQTTDAEVLEALSSGP